MPSARIWAPILGLSREENDRALEVAFQALAQCEANIRKWARETRYSISTNHKVWAAEFNARYPNLVALEVSSFKCGIDAPNFAWK